MLDVILHASIVSPLILMQVSVGTLLFDLDKMSMKQNELPYSLFFEHFKLCQYVFNKGDRAQAENWRSGLINS